MLDRLPDPREPDLEAAWNLEWERHLLEHALRQVKQQVDARQYQIFDCYVLKQWEVKDVVRALGVSAGQVYLAKHRVGALLAKAVQQLEQSGRAG
jgi:RNA polymerase sigma-70 factor (ECF subfamily)